MPQWRLCLNNVCVEDYAVFKEMKNWDKCSVHQKMKRENFRFKISKSQLITKTSRSVQAITVPWENSKIWLCLLWQIKPEINWRVKWTSAGAGRCTWQMEQRSLLLSSLSLISSPLILKQNRQHFLIKLNLLSFLGTKVNFFVQTYSRGRSNGRETEEEKTCLLSRKKCKTQRKLLKLFLSLSPSLKGSVVAGCWILLLLLLQHSVSVCVFAVRY